MCLKSWGAGRSGTWPPSLLAEVAVMEKVNVSAQRCHESQPSLVTATGVGAGDLGIRVPGPAWLPVPPRFLSPQASLSILTSYLRSAVPLK